MMERMRSGLNLSNNNRRVSDYNNNNCGVPQQQLNVNNSFRTSSLNKLDNSDKNAHLQRATVNNSSLEI
jgi:hypothetical protein